MENMRLSIRKTDIVGRDGRKWTLSKCILGNSQGINKNICLRHVFNIELCQYLQVYELPCTVYPIHSSARSVSEESKTEVTCNPSLIKDCCKAYGTNWNGYNCNQQLSSVKPSSISLGTRSQLCNLSLVSIIQSRRQWSQSNSFVIIVPR